MWHLIEKISEQVTKYSTWLGQLWYLCVFVFRLIVVVTIGGAVYEDEQSAFKCSTLEIGCTNMCFNIFSKISHIRFWAFQLLAVATPTVLFHFYSMNVTGQIEKLKKEEGALKMEEGEVEIDEKNEKEFKKMSRRKKSIGNVKVKKVYTGGNLKEIPFTTKIHYAYYISVILRLTLEAVFMYLAYQLFSLMDPTLLNNGIDASRPLDFIWFRVPAMYSCKGPDPEVMTACSKQLRFVTEGNVPCWVSRPWEKTVFIRYMSVLSATCFLLSALELVYLTFKGLLGQHKRHKPRFFTRRPHPRQDSVFYATTHNCHRLEENFYPTLAVPVRLGSRYPNDIRPYRSEKKVRISDEDEIVDGFV